LLIKPFLRTKRIAGIGKQSLINYDWGYACADGIVVLAEGLGMFRLGPIATGRRMITSSILSFAKRNWLNGCLGVKLREVWIALVEDLCDLRGTFWLMASMIGVGWPCPFSMIPWHLPNN
jgi:hypothetical protein